MEIRRLITELIRFVCTIAGSLMVPAVLFGASLSTRNLFMACHVLLIAAPPGKEKLASYPMTIFRKGIKWTKLVCCLACYASVITYLLLANFEAGVRSAIATRPVYDDLVLVFKYTYIALCLLVIITKNTPRERHGYILLVRTGWIFILANFLAVDEFLHPFSLSF